MRRWVLAGILLVASAIVLWLRRPSDPLAGLGPEEALRLANRWAFSRPEVTSYLTDRRLVFRFPDGRERSVDLPRDRMVVAVAPYLRATHPCRVHFPSSCRGELAGARFFVRVTETGGPVFFEGEFCARGGLPGLSGKHHPRHRRGRRHLPDRPEARPLLAFTET